MINSLELKNWRTHLNTRLEFEKGTNVIVGVMGSGKSSIVNSISYGLFGTFPSLKAKNVSIKEILMNKPNQTSSSTIKIEFEKDEKRYSIERELKLEGTNEAKLFYGKRLIAGPKQKDVNEKIEEILGLNYELFSRAVYAEQNEIDFFLKLSPNERKNKFDELLELEKYENVRKNSVFLKNSILKENKQKKEFLEQQKNVLSDSKPEELKDKITNLKKEVENNLKERESIWKNLKIYEKEYEDIQKEQKKYLELKYTLENLKTKISTLKKGLKKVFAEEIKNIEKEKKENFRKIKKVEEEIRIKENEINEFETAINKIVEKKSVLNYQKEEYLNEEKEISKLSGKCPTCKQELDDNHKNEIIKKSKEEAEKINKDIIQSNENEKEIKEVFDTAKKNILEIRKDRDNFRKIDFELNQKEKEVIENQKKEKEIKIFEEELTLKEKEFKKINFDEKLLKNKQEIYLKTKDDFLVLSEQLKSKEELVTNNEETLKKIEKINENIKLIEKEIEKSEKNAEKLGVFENCLTATQKELRVALLETINAAMSSIWSQIYPYKDFLDARILVTTNGYDVEVETRNGTWVRVEGILSGGERSAAAICIRIAFSLVLTKQLSMLILDEPTHNLDRNAVEKLSYMLRENLPNLVEQIFVITHDKELEAAATSNIYNLNRDKDNDGITKVELIENSF